MFAKLDWREKDLSLYTEQKILGRRPGLFHTGHFLYFATRIKAVLIKCLSLYWIINSCMCAKSLQSCLTLCDPRNSSWPGFPVHGILQASILKWVAMPSSRGSSRSRDRPATPALQASSLPLSHWVNAMSSVVSCLFVPILVLILFFPLSPLWKHLHLLILQRTFTLVFNYSPGSVHLPNFYKALGNW